MDRLSFPGRPFVAALAFSLAAHLLLFAPWRYGGGFLPSESGIEGRLLPPRLHAVLIDTGTGPDPEISKPTAVKHSTGNAAGAEQQLARKIEESPAALQSGVPLETLRYYSIKDVDQRPLLKRVPQLDNDPGQMKMQVTGSAVIELLIENNGQINAVNLMQADLPESYVRALRKAFLQVEYSPAIKQNRPVRSKLQIEVSYVDGVLNSMPGPELGNLPQTPVPHAPIDLGADRHERKKNPPRTRN